MKVVRYNPSLENDWNEFVRSSKNGTFHVERGFIEYHGDRFQDHSLLIYDSEEKLASLLPLNMDQQICFSHQGLSYAGFITCEKYRLDENMHFFRAALEYIIAQGCRSLYYKSISSIYHKSPAEDDAYFFFLLTAKTAVVHVNPVIALDHRMRFQERRARGVKKANKEGITFRREASLNVYWNLLTELLARYDAKPVHSLNEIEKLQKLYPQNIYLEAAFQGDQLLAGILLFESDTVAKFQYIGASEEGKNKGALDGLTDYLVNTVFVSKPFIDFGTSTLQGGRALSMGISQQKEGFGARTTVHRHYELDLTEVRWDNFEKAMQ